MVSFDDLKKEIKKILNSKIRSNETSLTIKMYEKFPEYDKKDIDRIVEKMITFEKLRNLNNLFSDFTVE